MVMLEQPDFRDCLVHQAYKGHLVSTESLVYLGNQVYLGVQGMLELMVSMVKLELQEHVEIQVYRVKQEKPVFVEVRVCLEHLVKRVRLVQLVHLDREDLTVDLDCQDNRDCKE